MKMPVSKFLSAVSLLLLTVLGTFRAAAQQASSPLTLPRGEPISISVSRSQEPAPTPVLYLPEAKTLSITVSREGQDEKTAVSALQLPPPKTLSVSVSREQDSARDGLLTLSTGHTLEISVSRAPDTRPESGGPPDFPPGTTLEITVCRAGTAADRVPPEKARAEEAEPQPQEWNLYTGNERRAKDFFTSPVKMRSVPLGGNKVRMTFTASNGYVYETVGRLDGKNWDAVYYFKDLHDIRKYPWIVTGRGEYGAPPGAVLEKVIKRKPYIEYHFEKGADGNWEGMRFMPGAQWDGWNNITEYRRDKKAAALRPAKQEFDENSLKAYWTRCCLDVGRDRTVPDIWLVRVGYRECSIAAAVLATKYPLSIVRNDQTDKYIWSINPAGEVIILETQVGTPEEIAALRNQAREMAGTDYFAEDEISNRIQTVLDNWQEVPK